MKISNTQISIIGIISGLISVFGVGLYQGGYFVLVFTECGKSAGLSEKIPAVVCMAIYALAVITFGYSILFLLIRWRRSKSTSVFLLAFLVLLVGLAIYRYSKHYVDERNFEFVFKGNLDEYQKISGGFSEQRLNDDLWMSARWGHIDMVRYLISRGADPNYRAGGVGSTALEAAHENLGNRPNENRAVVDYLISVGAQEQKEMENKRDT